MYRCHFSDIPLPIDLHMDFGEKSVVSNVLQKAYTGNVVDRRQVSVSTQSILIFHILKLVFQKGFH